jgi:hypothetical protein
MAELLNPVHKYHDESLSNSATQKYIISIQVSLNGFSFCVLDTELNKFVALESYKFEKVKSTLDLCREFESAILQHEFLQKEFRKLILITETPKSTLIPDALFDAAEKNLYLSFNHGFSDYEHVDFDSLTNVNCKNVFAVADCLKYKLEALYPNLEIVHHASVLIDSTLVKYKNDEYEKGVFINFRDGFFDLMVTESNNLQFYNAFEYRSSEDFIYYLMNALDQLKVNPQLERVVILGDIDKRSPLFEIMSEYIKDLEFGERTSTYHYSHVLAIMHNHQYYTLFNAHICEL